jgi:diguanylate cyclase (GGDEF)-like protein
MAHKLANQAKQITAQVIWLYVVTLTIMFLGTSLALSRNWIDKRQSTEAMLVHNASMVSALLDASLVDALKLLQITQSDLQRQDAFDAASSKINAVLRDAAERFSFYKQDDIFGLLFYIDPHGKIVAQSAMGDLPDVNVSDRRYFTELRRLPMPRYSIGNQVTARVTQNSVFHMAVPAINRKGEFVGIVAQQIKTDNLSNIIAQSHSQGVGNFISFLPDGKVLYRFDSEPSNILAPGEADMAEFHRLVLGTPIDKGNINAGPTFDGSLVGFVHSPNFDTVTVAVLPMRGLVWAFIKDQRYLLMYSVLGGAIVSVLFFLFYRKSIAYDRMQLLSVHDPLTGLHNRRGLDEDFPELFKQAQRIGSSISILFVDIDDFKKFNDVCGHEAGDTVLVRLSCIFQGELHRPLDFACRWGGEEFVIVLPDTDEAGAIEVGERILKAVRQNVITSLPMNNQHVTVSIGIASVVAANSCINDDLIDQADKAMLQAKRTGKDRLVVYGHAN